MYTLYIYIYNVYILFQSHTVYNTVTKLTPHRTTPRAGAVATPWFTTLFVCSVFDVGWSGMDTGSRLHAQEVHLHIR